MKGAKSLLCGLHKKKVDKKKKPHFTRQWSTYSYTLSGYSLESACARGDVNTVMEILDTMPYSTSKPKLSVALSNAAQAGHAEIVKALLDVGVDPNEPDPRGMTPLMHASYQGNLAVVKTLLDSEALLIDFEHHTGAGGTALHYACRSGHEDVIGALLAAGADPNAHFPGQESPLTLCAQHPQDLLPVIKTLVQEGADVTYCPDHAMPALHRVALRRCPETTIFLLENGANLQHWVSFTGPVLHRIAADKLSKSQCFCNTLKTIKALVDYDSVDLNCPVSGDTPLMCAVRRGNVDCVLTLLKLNADPDFKNKQGQTAVQLALSNDIPYKTKIVQMLMKAECSLQGVPSTATVYDVFTHDDEIYQEVKAAKSNPRSLQRQCRRVIRHHLRNHLEQKVQSLDLKEELKDFLLLKDLPDVVCICGNGEKGSQVSKKSGKPEVPVIKINADVTDPNEGNNNENKEEDQHDGQKSSEIDPKGWKDDSEVEDIASKIILKSGRFSNSLGKSDSSKSLGSSHTQQNKKIFMERTAQQSSYYSAGKKNQNFMSGPPSNGLMGLSGLLLSGPNGLSFESHEMAAAYRPRVASAGMVDLLKVRERNVKVLSKSASNSNRTVNKTTNSIVPPKNKTPEKAKDGEKVKTKEGEKIKAQKPQKKQEYIVVKFQ